VTLSIFEQALGALEIGEEPIAAAQGQCRLNQFTDRSEVGVRVRPYQAVLGYSFGNSGIAAQRLRRRAGTRAIARDAIRTRGIVGPAELRQDALTELAVTSERAVSGFE